MDPAISGDRAGRMGKECDVVCHRLDGLPMLIGMREDLVARHDAALDFIEDHLSAKLDQCAACMPRDGTGVRLKQAEHFLLAGHLLALKDTGARLDDHPLD